MDVFDEWNEKKKSLAGAYVEPLSIFPKEGQVCECFLGKNLGREQDGGTLGFSRPVLVVKKFNNQMFWAVPLSSRQKRLDFYFNFTDPKGREVSAILAQMRLLSIARFKRDMYVLADNPFIEIKARLRSYLG